MMTQGSQFPAESDSDANQPLFPVETEIFIRPDGSVVIADLPQELEDLLDLLHPSPQHEVGPHSRNDQKRVD